MKESKGTRGGKRREWLVKEIRGNSSTIRARERERLHEQRLCIRGESGEEGELSRASMSNLSV